jgi:hypothetical protein
VSPDELASGCARGDDDDDAGHLVLRYLHGVFG